MKLVGLFTLLLFTRSVCAENRLEFTIHQLDSGVPGPTVLVIGGIQGDEPGGFHAASLLVTNYKITSGSVWVVPNLNFESIINRSRGLHGDMNRKFATVDSDDPDYNSVLRIKDLITDPRIDMVINLHDGSGYYRKQYIDKQHNPDRWGQSIIIDEEILDVDMYAEIGNLSRNVSNRINKRLLDPEHRYAVKNTQTRSGNKEMEKSLTYFAITNGKSAIGIETSKNLPTHERAYYHLQAIESFLTEIGVTLKRDFVLDSRQVKQTINENLKIAFYENKLLLDISRARSRINYLPLQKNVKLDFVASNPLVAITDNDGSYRVNYGNRRITNLYPQYFEYDTSLETVTIETEGKYKQVALGNLVEVFDNFTITPREGYRFNVIGWKKTGINSEAGHSINMDSISKRFSLDREGSIYRVEVYKDEKFSGMVLVKFNSNVTTTKLTAKSLAPANKT